MSVSEMHGYTGRVLEDGWQFDCDAANCDQFISIYRDGHVFDSSTFGSIWTVSDFTDAETAFDLVADEFGWQRGTLGVQQGHHYCSRHRVEVDS